MTRATLLALADRVEALTGPCREADAEIFSAIGTHVLERRDRDKKAWWYPVGEMWSPRIDPYNGGPRYTASLDAAMTLVPEGWRIFSADFSVEGRSVWVLKGPCRLRDNEGYPGDDWYVECRAPTEPLALTAAALRARAMMETDHE